MKLKTDDMRVRYIYILLSVLLLAGCDERHPVLFEDISGVYFNNRSGSMIIVDSLDVTFVYEKDDFMDVPVKVQLIGRPVDHDRAVTVTVSSENAEVGVDFILPEDPILPAGASEMEYVVRLVRTDVLKSQKKMIALTIHENEHFTLPVTEIIQVADTVSTLNYRIFFSDMFTKAPAAWDENLVGEFTQQKFELICDVLNMDPADFNDPSVVTLAKLLYISAEMTAYVKDEMTKKMEGMPYDENIIDPSTGLPLNFGRK